MRTKIWDGEARGNVNCAFSEIGNGLVAALEEHKILMTDLGLNKLR